MRRAVILEDDPLLAEILRRIVSRLGFTGRIVADGATMLRALRYETFDLALLDWQVPELSGIDVLSWMTENLSPAPPVIMVTAREAHADIVRALESGADDYITKPFDPVVVAARISAVMRRAVPAAAAVDIEEIAGLVLSNRRHSIAGAGTSVQLTSKEFVLARTFLRNLGRPLARSYLLGAVWGHRRDLTTRTLDTHVSRLRTKLRPFEALGFEIVPVHGFGYRLHGPEGG